MRKQMLENLVNGVKGSLRAGELEEKVEDLFAGNNLDIKKEGRDLSKLGYLMASAGYVGTVVNFALGAELLSQHPQEIGYILLPFAALIPSVSLAALGFAYLDLPRKPHRLKSYETEDSVKRLKV